MNRVFMYPSLILVLALLGWSWFNPWLASTVFLIIAYSFFAFLTFHDVAGRPSPDPNEWTPEELLTIKRHHVFLQTPMMSRICNANLGNFRLSAFLWIPWLLWNRLFISSGVFALFYIISHSLSKRLDPFTRPVEQPYQTRLMQRLGGDPYERLRLAYIVDRLRKDAEASKGR
jgi:hypothetical protein